jgi:hypothetical protein
MRKLESAMRFASLANTDDDLMEINAEAILMASAFDQLLLAGRKSSSRNLGLRFAALFRDFSTATVAEAMRSRPDIEIDSNYAAVQPGWPAHRKWMEELYDARSQGVHKGHHKARTWGWTLREHLVMAAHVFPLAVKLLLAREGHYQFSEKDRDSAESVDKILVAKDWDDEPDERSSVWATIMSDAHSRRLWKRIAERMRAESSDTASSGQGKED